LYAPACFKSINLYFEDESRFGLHTKYGRGLAAKGVQPVCTFQQVFKSNYLFGAFSPITGEKFLLELPHCSGETFQEFLNSFSQINPTEYKIMVLDNGAFHKAKSLKIPSNIKLLFLPPYSPELNPAEKMWKHIKRKFTNKHFEDLEAISLFFTEAIKTITTDLVKSTCRYAYIFPDDFWSVI
jgi:transposase